MKKVVIILLLFGLLAFSVHADSGIIGTWTTEVEWDGEPVVEYFTFSPDGSGEWSSDEGKIRETFTYSLDEGTVTMTWNESGDVTTYDYKINKDGTLSLGIDYGYGDGYQEWIYQPVE
jgi:hypothetical protein